MRVQCNELRRRYCTKFTIPHEPFCAWNRSGHRHFYLLGSLETMSLLPLRLGHGETFRFRDHSAVLRLPKLALLGAA